MKNLKKLSIVLSIILSFSLALPVFAQDKNDDQLEIIETDVDSEKVQENNEDLNNDDPTETPKTPLEGLVSDDLYNFLVYRVGEENVTVEYLEDNSISWVDSVYEIEVIEDGESTYELVFIKDWTGIENIPGVHQFSMYISEGDFIPDYDISPLNNIQHEFNLQIFSYELQNPDFESPECNSLAGCHSRFFDGSYQEYVINKAMDFVEDINQPTNARLTFTVSPLIYDFTIYMNPFSDRFLSTTFSTWGSDIRHQIRLEFEEIQTVDGPMYSAKYTNPFTFIMVNPANGEIEVDENSKYVWAGMSFTDLQYYVEDTGGNDTAYMDILLSGQTDTVRYNLDGSYIETDNYEYIEFFISEDIYAEMYKEMHYEEGVVIGEIDNQRRAYINRAELEGTPYEDMEVPENETPITYFEVYEDVPETFYASFNPDNGDPISYVDDIISGDTIEAPTTPVKAGFDFGGWEDEDGIFPGIWDFDNDTITRDTFFIAKWVPENTQEKVTVTFDYNDENETSNLELEIDKGTSVSEPNEPTRDGYAFEGWYLGAVKYDFSKAVDTDITLVAKWTKVHKVTFDYNDGSTASTTVSVKDLELVNEPSEPTRDGYAFEGWYLGSVEYDFTKAVKNDLELVAKWTKVHKVTFDYNDGSTVSTTVSVKDLELVNEPSEPTRDGYAFEGWYLGSVEYDFTKAVENDLELVAKWTRVHKVTFDYNDGSTVSTTISVKDLELVNEPSEPTRDGYAFEGWYLGSVEYDFTKAVENDLELVAKWTKVHKVTFDYNDGSTASTTISVKDLELVDEPSEPTRDGYAFEGWYLGTVQYDFTKAVENDLELVAKWTKVHKVTFDYNDGSTDATSVNVKDRTLVSEPITPTRKGYTFEGWYLNTNQYDFSLEVTFDMTLVAHWSKDNDKEEEEIVPPVVPEEDSDKENPKKEIKEESKEETPKTGVQTNVLGYSLVLLVSALFIVLKKKKHN